MEGCPICGEKPAHKKVGEEFGWGEDTNRHNLTMYLCALCFTALLMPPLSEWKLVRVAKCPPP